MCGGLGRGLLWSIFSGHSPEPQSRTDVSVCLSVVGRSEWWRRWRCCATLHGTCGDLRFHEQGKAARCWPKHRAPRLLRFAAVSALRFRDEHLGSGVGARDGVDDACWILGREELPLR